MFVRYLFLPSVLLELVAAVSNSSASASNSTITSLPTSFATIPAATGSGSLATNGSGLAYASSCNHAKIEWVEHDGSTYLTNSTFTTSTSSLTYTSTETGWIETVGPTEVYTLCDGYPRMNASTDLKTIITTQTRTLWSTFVTETEVYRSAGPPDCAFGPQECSALQSGYAASLVEYSSYWSAPSPTHSTVVTSPTAPICGRATLTPDVNSTLAPAACMYNYATIQLLYWPVSTVGNHICGNSYSIVEATPTVEGKPNTAVAFNTTFTSPTVYMVLSGAIELGGNFEPGTAINGILPMAPTAVSSMCAQQGGGFGPPEPMDYADFDAPIPASKYRCQPNCWTKPDYPQSAQDSAYNITATENLCSTIYDQVYKPALQVPIAEFNSFFGDYSGVGLDFGQNDLSCSFSPMTDGIFYDPPSALQQFQSAGGPSVPNAPGAGPTTAVPEEPQTTPAAPAPTAPTALPQTTGGDDDVPQPTVPNNPEPSGSDGDGDGSPGQETPAEPDNGDDGTDDDNSGDDGGGSNNGNDSDNDGSPDFPTVPDNPEPSGSDGDGDGSPGQESPTEPDNGDDGTDDDNFGDDGGPSNNGDGSNNGSDSDNDGSPDSPIGQPTEPQDVGGIIASIIGITRTDAAGSAPAGQTPSLESPQDSTGSSGPSDNPDSSLNDDQAPASGQDGQGVILTDSAGQTTTAIYSGDSLILPSATLAVGQETSLAGIGQISVGASGVEQSGQTLPYQTVSPDGDVYLVNEQSYTAGASDSYLVIAPGVTLTAGAAATTVSGTTYSLDVEGGGLIVNGVTATRIEGGEGGTGTVSSGVPQQTGNGAGKADAGRLPLEVVAALVLWALV